VRLLVLGGTHHVGRAVVEVALAAGHAVTTVNRGSVAPADGVDARSADRRVEGELESALDGGSWDAVIDTWSHEPVVVREAARVLSGRVGHYGYVSSRSVHTWPIPSGADESAPVVDGDPGSTDPDDYPAAKRGAELAVDRFFDGPALHARAGLVLGPYEQVGRLPWWLNRVAAGGRVAAPGPPERALQYIDGRDLARWMLHAAAAGTAGAFNAVSAPGHTTIEALLTCCREVTGSNAELVWLTPEQVEDAGVSGWTDLPIWVPPTGELAALHDADTTAARAAGLRCRDVTATVADTWAWLQREGTPPRPSDRAGDVGLTAEQEARLLGRAQEP
jgi:2'-hydroxyisoflavone reductase